MFVKNSSRNKKYHVIIGTITVVIAAVLIYFLFIFGMAIYKEYNKPSDKDVKIETAKEAPKTDPSNDRIDNKEFDKIQNKIEEKKTVPVVEKAPEKNLEVVYSETQYKERWVSNLKLTDGNSKLHYYTIIDRQTSKQYNCFVTKSGTVCLDVEKDK